MATRPTSAGRIGRTAVAVFAMTAAFTLTGTSSAAAGTAGIDLAGPRYIYYYYAEPERQNLVGMRVVTFCPDVPVEEWGERTEWYDRYQEWVQCQ